jgi:hypothetical protein
MEGGQSGRFSTQVLPEYKAPPGSGSTPHYYLSTQLLINIYAPVSNVRKSQIQ